MRCRFTKVDFYGDSYGTYVGQTFAARYGGRLRSIILDSAYPGAPPGHLVSDRLGPRTRRA